MAVLAVRQQVERVLLRSALRLRFHGSGLQLALHHMTAPSVQKDIKYFALSKVVFHLKFDS